MDGYRGLHRAIGGVVGIYRGLLLNGIVQLCMHVCVARCKGHALISTVYCVCQM
jgi:hypothetical protein